MAGFVYFFNTVSDGSIYKAGETQQESVASRMRSYLGPSKPRTIVVSRAVDDAREAERLLLALLKQCVHFRFRPDYGDEWFEAVTADVEKRHRAAILIMDVVQRACEAHPGWCGVAIEGEQRRFGPGGRRSGRARVVSAHAPRRALRGEHGGGHVPVGRARCGWTNGALVHV